MYPCPEYWVCTKCMTSIRVFHYKNGGKHLVEILLVAENQGSREDDASPIRSLMRKALQVRSEATVTNQRL